MQKKLGRIILYVVVGVSLLLTCAYYGWRIYAVEKLARASQGITKSVPEHVVWSEPVSKEGLQRIDVGFASFCVPKREWYTVYAKSVKEPPHWFDVSIFGADFMVHLMNVWVPEQGALEVPGGVIGDGVRDFMQLYQTPPLSWREIFCLSNREFLTRVSWLTLRTEAWMPNGTTFTGPYCEGTFEVSPWTSDGGLLEIGGLQKPTSMTMAFYCLEEGALRPESFAELLGSTFVFNDEVDVSDKRVLQAAFVERVLKGEGDDARFIMMNVKAMPVFPLADALKAAKKLLAAEGLERPCVSASSTLCRESDGWLLRYGPTKEEGFAVLVTPDSVQLIKDAFLADEGVPAQPIEEVLPLTKQTPERFAVGVRWYGGKWDARVYEAGNCDLGYVSLETLQESAASTP